MLCALPPVAYVWGENALEVVRFARGCTEIRFLRGEVDIVSLEGKMQKSRHGFFACAKGGTKREKKTTQEKEKSNKRARPTPQKATQKAKDAEKFSKELPVSYIENFYSQEESQKILTGLNKLTFKPTYTWLFQKVGTSPRQMLWFTTNKEWTYRYSRGHIEGIPAQPFTEALLEIKRKVEAKTNQTFNALLINRYEGTSGVGWHSDDDPWLGTNFIVPSLSFGATREFQLRPKSDKKNVKSVKLENGSLIIMEEGCQENWQHQIPKRNRNLRYNLTFRNILPELVEKQNQKYPGITWEAVLQKLGTFNAEKRAAMYGKIPPEIRAKYRPTEEDTDATEPESSVEEEDARPRGQSSAAASPGEDTDATEPESSVEDEG